MMTSEVASDFTIKTSHYIIGGVALVTALSWKDTVKEVIDKTFPMPKQRAQANLVYSVIITLILVFLVYILPDTKKELPIETQQKIVESEENGKLRKENLILKKELYKQLIEKEKNKNRLENYKNHKDYAQYKKPKYTGLDPFNFWPIKKPQKELKLMM